jgi:hypothetical protein
VCVAQLRKNLPPRLFGSDGNEVKYLFQYFVHINLFVLNAFISFQKSTSTMGQVTSMLWGPPWKPSRQIRIDTGLIQGKTFEIDEKLNVDAFLGIPYAKPPVGALRFKVCLKLINPQIVFQKPEPVDSWAGVRDCTKFGPRCPHEDVSIEKLTVFHPKSEDCLSLNVFTPVTADKFERLPVAV